LVLATIALWWCYITGGALALGITSVVVWWSFDNVVTRLGYTKLFIEWYWKVKLGRGGKILTTKSNL